MKLQTAKRLLSFMTSCLILSATTQAISPLTGISASSNIITNSTFDSSTSDWGVYKESGGSATLTTVDGKLALNIQSLGKVNYAVQVYYDIIPLYQGGVYRLSYDISCSTDRYVEGMIQQNGGTYQAYTWKGLDLTTETQTVDYEFTMKADTDIMSKLVFNCGNQGDALDPHTIYLDNVVLELIDDSNVDYSSIGEYEPPITTNQIGYRTNSKKIAVFRNIGNEKEFSVINADTGAVVYTGELYGETMNSSADETNWFGDFSALTDEGIYYIKCGNLDQSYSFKISEDAYNNLLDDTVKMLYLQRCGCEVIDDTFGHKACHTSLATVYGTNQKIDVSGGWHDAGDYGRYIVPAAKTVADLLNAYAANPELYSDKTGIPESGNGVPDILDEVRYELEWMKKMQAESGGVYHKVTCETFPGYIMPEKEIAELIVTPVSTTATADFCASMAMAYEYYYDIDRDFAEECLKSAEAAWNFLESNPNFIYVNPSSIVTGAYGDTVDRDERYWAAAQMYRATAGEEYLTKLEGMSVFTGLDWSTVGDYGNIAILTMPDIDKTLSVYTKAKSSVVAQANSLKSRTASNPYGAAVTKFNWGSNMTIANAGVILGLAYNLTDDSSYLEAADENLNYLLGRNPLGECFVTGYGTVSPQNPHHRPSMAKGQAMKGMLVGGVNSSLEDSAAKAYLKYSPAAKCYVDNGESYSTNEITIYWNSPLTYLLSLTDNADTQNGAVTGDVNADGLFNEDDLIALQGWLLNDGTKLADWKAGDLSSDGTLDVFDLAEMRKALS